MSHQACRRFSFVYFWLLLGVLLSAPLVNAAEKLSGLPEYSNEELLTQMLVVDVAERTLDNSSALAITFSQDLQPSDDLSSFVTLTVGGKSVAGNWVLINEPRRLYFPNIQPQTEYRIQIRPGVTSQNKLKLQKPLDITLKTRDILPAFDFASRGSLLPAKLTDGLPIRVVNVPELDIEFLRVQPDKLHTMLKRIRLGERLGQWQLEEIHEATTSVYANRYLTGAKPNADTAMSIPVETIPELQTQGLYFAVMRQPGRFGEEAYRIVPFVVSNIGLHVRLYSRGMVVFANALDTGKPLQGVNLELQGDNSSLEVVTDENGQASFTHLPQGSLLLTAELGGQFAFLDVRDTALDLSGYAVTGNKDRVLAPFVYGNRDLFRPGDTLDLSALLRERDGKPVSVSHLNLRLVRPDQRVVLDEDLTASNPDLGFFSYRFPIPVDAPNGEWQAEVRLHHKDEIPASRFAFRVEAFVPERMALSLATENKRLASGEKLMVAVQGDYLHGVPAAGNRVTASRSVAVNHHPLDAFRDYYFGHPEDRKLAGKSELPDVLLSETGGGFLEVPALEGKIHSPLNVSIMASLHETGGRSSSGELKVPFWPAPQLVGIKPEFAHDTVDAGGDAAFELIRVMATGEAAPLDRPLVVSLVKESGDYFWKYSDKQGWLRQDASTAAPVLQQKVQLDDKALGRVVFAVQRGFYRLEVEDPQTGLKTVYPFHAGWDREQSENAANRPDRIELSLDKPAYVAGDVARLSIRPPAAGEAVVAVEGDGLLWSQRIHLPTDGLVMDIPVDKQWNRHDLYVTVMGFHPADPRQKVAPQRMLGVLFLPLEREERRLQLVLETPEQVLPEQKVNVTVRADQLAGQAAIVTLATVDTAALAATGFKTPDPFAFYFSQHEYAVRLYDDYGKIIRENDGLVRQQSVVGGAGHDKASSPTPVNAGIVALFSGAVSFDQQGVANIDLQLPAFDGTLRLMAVAATAESFGNAERELKVATPVAANLAAPGFLAIGDNAFVSVDLHNSTSEQQAINLKLSASLALKMDTLDKEILLKQGERTTLQFPLATSGQMLGNGLIRLELVGKHFTLHRELPLIIRPAVYPARQLVLNRVLQPKESMDVNAAVTQGFMSAGLTANLNLSPVPALPVRTALQGLSHHTSDSLEQVVSRLWPYLYLQADMAESLGMEALSREQLQRQLNHSWLRLGGMQLPDGGFALWDGSVDASDWLAPHMADFMQDAKNQGFAVPEWLWQRTLTNLQQRLEDNTAPAERRYAGSEAAAHLDLAVRAYAGYVLARTRKISLVTLRALYDESAGKAVSGLPLVHLGLALNMMGDKQRGAAAIQQATERVRDDRVSVGDYGSALREEAAMFYLLLRNKLLTPDEQAGRINTLAEWLRKRTRLSAQEQLFVALAGLEVGRKSTGGWQAILQKGADTLELEGNGLQIHSFLSDVLHQGITLAVGSKTALYASLSLTGYPDIPVIPDNDPIEIRREWYDMMGKKVQLQDIRHGQLLLVHLSISSNVHIRDAMVVDLLPAAFEIEKVDLKQIERLESLVVEGDGRTVLELMGNNKPRMEKLQADRYSAALPLVAKNRHHLFYIVRVIAEGEFVVPPPHVEDLYRPELNGTGASPGILRVAR